MKDTRVNMGIVQGSGVVLTLCRIEKCFKAKVLHKFNIKSEDDKNLMILNVLVYNGQELEWEGMCRLSS